jgi:NadR type nicotinamide-nucleotide adenylyltransferase
MRIGLTLGKYAPFHSGHCYVIDRAIKEMDKVIVVVYDSPSTTDIPLSIRGNWIKQTYLNYNVEVILGYGSPEDIGLTEEIKRKQEDYLHSIVKERIDAFYCSEPYGEHVSESFGCRCVLVDVDRREYSISGTDIRKDPYICRKFISSFVYWDLIRKVLFLGAPSTGKSTLVERLAKEIGTVFVPEYGREYWEKHQRNKRLTVNDLEMIVDGHLRSERDIVYSANRYMFIDTSPLTTMLFARYYFGDSGISKYLRLKAEESNIRYDVVFLCDEDIPYADTWDRSGEVNRHMFQRMYYDELAVRKIPFYLVSGTLEERVRFVKLKLNIF